MDYGGAVKLIEAAKQAGVSRYVIVSSMGANPEAPGDDTFSVYLRAKGRADDAVRASGLDATVVRPGGLTNDPGTGRVNLGESLPSRQGDAGRRRGGPRRGPRLAKHDRPDRGPDRRRHADRGGRRGDLVRQVRRVLGHALGAVSIALLLAVLAVPALARNEVAPLAAQKTAVSAPPEKPPGRTHDAKVRALPLAPSGGLVAREFPDGQGLDDPDRVRASLDELLPQLGLQSIMPRLLDTMPEWDEDGGYPYTYAPHDSLIRRRPPPGVERSGPTRRGGCGHADDRSRDPRHTAACRNHRLLAAQSSPRDGQHL